MGNYDLFRIMLILVCVLIVIYIISEIYRMFGMKKTLDVLDKQNKLIKEQNKRLEKQNEKIMSVFFEFEDDGK